MELDLQNPLTNDEDLQYDDVAFLFANESDHMPCLLSFESSDIRRSAVSLISHMKFSYGLDPFLVYLSVNYVDRFLSKQEILERRPWITHILVVASLSLAAKMRNFDSSTLLSNLQGEEGFEFDAQSVHRMETLLLAALKWRMRSITPFSFLQYFMSLFKIEDSSLALGLKHRASDIIFNVQNELKFLEYKPSTIAASALLCAIQDLCPPTFCSSETAISSCEYLNKDTLLKCLGMMQEIIREGYEPSLHAMPSGTLTPVSVLDQQQRTSLRSEEGFPDRDDIKRRRLNGYCNNVTFQVSQIHHC